MTDYSADNIAPPNGPAPFTPQTPSRPADEAATPPGGTAQTGFGTGSGSAPLGSAPASPSPAPASPSPSSSPSPFGRPGGAPSKGDQPGGSIGGSVPAPQNGAPQRMAGSPEVKGRIEVADEVVEKVAALAAMEVPGVADLGGDIARALENVRDRIGIGQKRGDQGIKARVVNREVTVDVTIVIEYGFVVMEVAHQVKHNVASQTSRMLGLRVTEVNVTVDDVKLPEPPKTDEDSGDLLPLD